MHGRQWARIHASLGFTYANRSRGVRGANLERALRHYRVALAAYCQAPTPAGRAAGGGGGEAGLGEVPPEVQSGVMVTVLRVALAGAYYDRKRGARVRIARAVVHHVCIHRCSYV